MNFIANIFKENVLIHYLQTQIVQFMKLKQDVSEDFYKNKNLFDFSDYPKDLNFLILSIKKSLVK